MRSNFGRMPVLRGHRQLRKASKQDEATAGSARPCFRGVSRNNPMSGRLETGRTHALRLSTDNNDCGIENASMSFIESRNNR
jgi:hypothetical protein